MGNKCNMLLIEDNPGDARLVQEYLGEVSGTSFGVTHADCVSKGEEYLAKEEFDIILLDMALPDGKGPELVLRILSQAPHIPVIVLTGTYEDEAMACEALRQGAQDYLIKGKIDGPGLTRAIRYAIERKSSQGALDAAKKQLEEKVHELEVMNRAMMNREERILELKDEVKLLQKKIEETKVTAR